MNGAESLLRTARAAGVELCLANPGTTEMPLVAALDATGIRGVLGLFEGVCTGAADGYARMADRPALALLHLGPGLANGIANLHNARRARSPVVVVVGDHATWHRRFDAPLTSDISSLAWPVSAWVRNAWTAKQVAADCAEAIAAATRPPGGVATLIVPSDVQWDPADEPSRPRSVEPAPAVLVSAVERCARALRNDTPGVLLLGGPALREPGLRAAARIRAATGCRVVCETFPARLERGAGLPAVERLPYFPDQALASLKGSRTLVTAGTAEPVSFFAYPGQSSRLTPEGCTPCRLAMREEDVIGALEALAEAVDAGPGARGDPPAPPPERPSGELSPASVGAAIAATQREGAIVVDEANTSGLPYFASSAGAPPFTYLGLTGGAIGQGLPVATGAALACPDRPVIAFQADGSAMYTLQSLWTQAREGLDVTTVLCANRSYRILQVELARSGVAEPGAQARSLMDLSRPDLDWVQLARGQGVPAERVDSAEALVRALEHAQQEPGPHLIEVPL